MLKKGDYVVYESTVYPGCTKRCIPVLEEHSGLKFPNDFKVGYSPERINPGDKEHTITKIKKKKFQVAMLNHLILLIRFIETIVTAGASCQQHLKVAEAAKIIENTQRDVNIALMNELSIIFNEMGINTYGLLRQTVQSGTSFAFSGLGRRTLYRRRSHTTHLQSAGAWLPLASN